MPLDRVFSYTDGELAALKARDPVLAREIDRIGRLDRAVLPDLFSALINSIVGQQISAKAFITVWGRLLLLLTEITPENVLAVSPDALRNCGLSGRKTRFIQGCAERFATGALSAEQLSALSDEALIKTLTALPGVGLWTAEMLMLFSLERKDVLSYGDFGIRKGVMRLYGLESVSKEQFEALRARYSPYGSIASFYLWYLAAEPV